MAKSKKAIKQRNRELRLSQEAAHAKLVKLQQVFDESPQSAVCDANLMFVYNVAGYIPDIMYETEKILEDFNLAVKLQKKAQAVEDAVYEYMDCYTKMTQPNKDCDTTVGENFEYFKGQCDQYMKAWRDYMMRIHRDTLYQRKYGKPVAQENYGRFCLIVYDTQDGKFMCHIATANNPIGYECTGANSIEQAIIIGKNMSERYDEKFQAEVNAKLELERKIAERNQWILEHS